MTIAAKSLEELSIDTIRTLSIDTVQKANSGHPGLPLGAAPMAYVLWQRHLSHNPRDPRWPDRDRFVLSAGHGSALLYSLLHLTGYDLTLDDLKAFRQWESRTPGHPEVHLTPGVEATTGPLGQGTANAVGMAMAERFLAHRFNRPGHEIVNHRTFCLVGDGDLMEGISSEAASLAGHLKLGRLIYLYDDNHVTLDGPAQQSFTEDVLARYAAYGWQVLRVENGNTDLDGIDRAIQTAVSQEERPTIVAVRTTIGYGSPHKAGTSAAHGSPLGAEEVALTKKALGWEWTDPFHIPKEALEHLRSAVAPGRKGRGGLAAPLRGVREGLSGAGGTVARRGEGRAAEGLGRGPSEVEGGRVARDPRGLREGPQRDRQTRAVASRGRRGPFGVDEDQDRGRGRVRRLDGRGEQHPLRRARARDGRDRQRHVLPRGSASLRRHVLLLLGLHAPVDPPGGAVAPADDLRLDARLDRTRRGRPHPPGRRAAHVAAGDAALRDPPPGRRERVGRGVARGPRAPRGPGRPRLLPSERARPRPVGREGRRVARRLHPGGGLGRKAPAHPDGHGLGAPARRGRAPEARGGGDPDPGRFDAVLGVLRRAAARVPRRSPAAGRESAALDRSRSDPRMAEVRRRRGRLDRRRPLRRLGARRNRS